MQRFRKLYKLDSIGLIVCVIATCLAMAHSFYFFSQGKTNQTDKKFIYEKFVSKNYSHVFETNIEAEDPKIRKHRDIRKQEILMRLIDERKQDYITNNENLTLLTQLLTAFLVLGALILFYNPNEFQMPFIEVRIPATLFHLFIAFGMVYLWIQFGLALNTGVDGRLALNFLIKDAEHFDSHTVSASFSEVHTLIDKGIIDAWCQWYYRIFDTKTHGSFHDIVSWIGLYIVYGGFWGAIHATAIMLSTTIYEKKRNQPGGKLLLILFIITLLLLAVASVTFVVEFKHASRLIGVTWLIATCILIYWIKWGRAIALKKNKLAMELSEEVK